MSKPISNIMNENTFPKISMADPVSMAMKAANFAAKKHSTQRRKDAAKTPYINHPIGVANILTEEGNHS